MVFTVGWAGDGRTVATCGLDGSVKLWDPSTGKERFTLEGHSAPVVGVAFRQDGALLATAGQDGLLGLWEARTGRRLRWLKGHTGGGINDVVFTPGGKLLSAAADGAIREWDLDAEQDSLTRRSPKLSINGITFLADNRHLLVAGASGLELWDTRTAARVRTLTDEMGFDPIGLSLAGSPDGKLVAVGNSNLAGFGTTLLFDVASGKALDRRLPEVRSIAEMVFSPDGKSIAVAGADTLVFQVADGSLVHRLAAAQDEDSATVTVAYSRDGRWLAVGGKDGNTVLWDTSTWTQSRAFPEHPAAVLQLQFSPDGRQLLSAGESQARVWDVATGAERQRFDIRGTRSRSQIDPEGNLRKVAFSGDGRRLATAFSDGPVRIWDVETGQLILTLADVVTALGQLTFSPDGRRLVLGGFDGKGGILRIWDGTPP
jgi:WD40 repeat protein